MSLLERAAALQRRRLERAQEALHSAVGAQRRVALALANARAELDAHRAHLDASEERLWAQLAGRPCGPADFERVHARRAVLQAQLLALSETAGGHERAHVAAGEAVVSQRIRRNGASRRLEKFVHLVADAQRDAQTRMEAVADEQLDEIALQRHGQANHLRAMHA